MFFNWNLFIEVISLGILSGIISTIFIQKIKETKFIHSSKKITIISIIIHFFTGFNTSLLFTNLSWYMAFEVGIITWIGSQSIYKKMRKKGMIENIYEINNSNHSSVDKK